MTVSGVPRYDADRVAAGPGRAVVIGGSMASLTTARVLADAFEEVCVVERDPLPDEPVARPGAPQARHVHVMHEAARRTLEDLLPGFGEDLLSAGALLIDLSTTVDVYDEGGFLADGPSRLPMYCASRPLFEQVTRRRVELLDGVTVRDGCRVTDYLVDDGAAVEGVVVRGEDSNREEIAAELVVDATGRTSRLPTWLEEHGFRPPPTDEVDIDLAYTSAVLERPEDDRRALFAPPCEPRARGGGVFPVEDGRWLMTLSGVHGERPPTDVEGFADYAASLPVSGFADLLREHALVSEELDHYPFPSAIRRHYEALDRFPRGLLAVGDAVASFNPIYGQGMSVAALEALQLHHALAAGDRDELAPRFFERAADVVDDAWNLSVCSDFAFSETTGAKPRGTDLLNRYVARVKRTAHDDPVVADALSRVISMEERPTALFRPGVLWRVLSPGR